MKVTYHLNRMQDVPLPPHVRHRYPADVIQRARETLEARDLRFNNRTGETRDNRLGLLARFVTQADFIPHNGEAEVMEWEFSRYIANSCSRIQAGHTP